MLINFNKYKDAKKYIYKAIDIARDNDYLNSVAEYLDCLAIIYRYEKKYEKSLLISKESLSINEKIGDKNRERRYLNSVGLVKEYTANYSEALGIYLKCLELSKNINEKRSITVSYNNIGCIYKFLNEPALAIKNFKKALTFSKRINYMEGVAAFQFNIALVYGNLENYQKAFQFIKSSISDYKKIDSVHSFIASCEIYRTFIHLLKKDKKELISSFESIKHINSSDDIGCDRSFELYRIYRYLKLDGLPFLKQSHSLLSNEIKYILSDKDKLFFINHVGYNKLILEDWKSYNSKLKS